MHHDKRLRSALAREGLDVTHDGSAWTVRLRGAADTPAADILLPPSLPVEARAFRQLAELAAVRHPDGGRVAHACASPDFHPGDAGVAIGSVVASSDLVIPQAVGGDINCGMRLHVVDLPLDTFLAGKATFVERLKGDFFFGTRDVAMRGVEARAMLEGGLPAWLLEHDRRHGSVRRSDWGQLLAEVDRVHLGGSLPGAARWAPAHLADAPATGLVRDDGLATIGGGNHFVEVLAVDEVVDRSRAFAWGVRRGQLAFMVHSGSRHVGKHVGGTWLERARDAWPSGVRHPPSGIFPLSRTRDPELVAGYLEAEATAANYGFVNRMLLAELVRLRLREVFGDIAAPLVYDLPHNITLREGDRWVARKGACPAGVGDPVIIPGSMGTASYLLVGLGHERLLASASHGAGRAVSRFAMDGRSPDALGLDGVECITLRDERRIQEAPAAYKPIQPVIDCQVAAGLVAVVARMRPILTFKA